MRQFGGPWTTDKLERVRKYLQAYTTALKNKPFTLIYVDAFAGSGYLSFKGDEVDNDMLQLINEPETKEFIAGSARLALEIQPPFSEYIFIEKDRNNVAELEKLPEEKPELRDRISVVQGDANDCIRDLCGTDWIRERKRGVMFLDPYGMQVNWETVRSIARTKAIDLWYLFPLGSVNRLLKRDGRISEGWKRRLDDLFGQDDWYDAFYQIRETPTLFGDEETSAEKIAGFRSIKRYIVGRLESEFAGVASNPLVLSNSANSPLYLLCFAVGNPNGAPIALRIAQNILGK